MPKERTSRKSTTSTTAQSQPKLTTPLRRSNRLIHQQRYLNADNPKLSNIHADNKQKASKELRKYDGKPSIGTNPVLGLRRSPRFSKMVEGVSNIRRSLRLSFLGNSAACNEKSEHDKSNMSSESESSKLRHSASHKSTSSKSNKKSSNRVLDKSTDYKAVLLNKEKEKVGSDSCDEIVQRIDRRTQGRDVEVVMGLKAAQGKFAFERSQGTRVIRKRKRGEDSYGSVKGWTREQEVALQKAYFAAKPTPNFWKKVSKLVPGKTAQDCFEKIHSDHITPPQPLPQSRAKRMSSSSPLGCFSLSAGKLLSPSHLMVKRSTCYKQKSRIAQKTVRQLLQKHNRKDQNYEADLFSILEPNVNPSGLGCQQNDVSTPQHLQEKQGFLQKCHERSSGQKKPLSRFGSSCWTDLVSPPVLKQVKNRALHEKYIDQLHCREAKRKAACARTGKENRGQANIQKIDVVRAAKNALVSDARDAINKLQHVQTDVKGDSTDLDEDGVINSDDEIDGF